MAKLGKPKGSRNKKTLEKRASATRKNVNTSGSLVPQAQSALNLPSEAELQSHTAWDGLELAFKANENTLPGAYTPNPGFSSVNNFVESVACKRPMGYERTATNDDESSSHVGTQFAMDFEENWIDADWDRLIAGTGAERQPRSGFTHGGPDHVYPEGCGDPKSSAQLKPQADEGGNHKGQTCTFNCFWRLMEHLSNLNLMERQPDNIIDLEVTLSKADTVLGCTRRILGCYSCRLDSKVLLLLMTVLQTVLNWMRVEYTMKKSSQNSPAILFGNWKVPEADARLIKGVLTRRILAAYESAVKVLCLRMDEIALGASRENLTYQLMDAESLQHTLQRLTTSLKQLIELTKTPSQEREVHDVEI
ncbi:hypothetical protein ETB97_011512 [Aspergillus alliaceus]|uniref:Uncharacterized protein n=1 Tax=Petromyces alliaceus TaxID=209559 RepID=A0A8H5ZT97_PETAA|nr:hypothetical protein ETB97_011512 [Aspergillus burnettii]